MASDIAFDFRGTLLYAAPEVLTSKLGPGNRKAYQKPADIWALGCTFIEMLVRYPPHYEYFGHVKEVLTEVITRATGPEEDVSFVFILCIEATFSGSLIRLRFSFLHVPTEQHF